MERPNRDRSYEVAQRLEPAPSSPVEAGWTPIPSPDNHAASADQTVPTNEYSRSIPQPPIKTTETLPPEVDPLQTVRRAFDMHLRRLERLHAGLRQAIAEPVAREADQTGASKSQHPRKRASHEHPQLLHETLVYLDQLEHPPLLPAPQAVGFEEAFKRHEPMFHTVFYRKYPPWVLDDAKQEGLLALYRKWLKDKTILEQSPAYVVQAAIYGVSNWRQKGMKVRANEAALIIDPHGKVIGEPRYHSQERWTDRIDLKLDVAKAVERVLNPLKEHPDYRAIYRVMEDIRHEVPFKRGQQASGLSFRAYKQYRDQVKAGLRTQLAAYARPLNNVEQR